MANPHPVTQGRPPGVPNKATAEIRMIAREYGPEALEKLVMLMRGVTAKGAEPISHETQRAAAVHILDRGYGKSIQPHDENAPGQGGMVFNFDIKSLTLPQLEMLVGRLLEARGQ